MMFGAGMLMQEKEGIKKAPTSIIDCRQNITASRYYVGRNIDYRLIFLYKHNSIFR